MNDNQLKAAPERWLADAERAVQEGQRLQAEAAARFAYAEAVLSAFKPDGRRKPLTSPDLMAALGGGRRG